MPEQKAHLTELSGRSAAWKRTCLGRSSSLAESSANLTEIVYHDGIAAHLATRIIETDDCTSANFCFRCGWWFKPLIPPAAEPTTPLNSAAAKVFRMAELAALGNLVGMASFLRSEEFPYQLKADKVLANLLEAADAFNAAFDRFHGLPTAADLDATVAEQEIARKTDAVKCFCICGWRTSKDGFRFSIACPCCDAKTCPVHYSGVP